MQLFSFCRHRVLHSISNSKLLKSLHVLRRHFTFNFMIQTAKDNRRQRLTLSTDVMKTEQPMSVKIMRPVKRCSLMPRNLGCSPGAEHSDSSFRLLTWVMESTVAATNQGRPIKEHTPSITPTMNRSRWYPQPF